MLREEGTPDSTSQQESPPPSSSGNAGSDSGNSGSGNAGTQGEPSSVPVIEPIALEPHRRGLFEIPKYQNDERNSRQNFCRQPKDCPE